MAGHVTYREFSTGMIRCPATQVVNSAVDYYPVITFTVVLFHLTEAIIFHLLHPEKITTKNNSSRHSATGNRRLSIFIFARAHRLSTDGLCLTRSLIGSKQSSNCNQPIRISSYQNSLSVESHTSCHRSKVYSKFALGFLSDRLWIQIMSIPQTITLCCF